MTTPLPTEDLPPMPALDVVVDPTVPEGTAVLVDSSNLDVDRIGQAAGRAAGGRAKLDPMVVTLVEEVGRRVTTWAIECPTHGRFPLDVKSKTAAIVVGGRHVEAEHFGEGKLRLRRRRRRGA